MSTVQGTLYKVNVGDKFERWTVLGASFLAAIGSRMNVKRMVVARCDCGTVRAVGFWDLVGKRSRSCGCIRAETCSRILTTHGQSYTRIYNLWRGIRNRCENIGNPRFASYGGRGIRVCEQWQSFLTFKKWCVQHGWVQGLQIDRIDNDGNYESSNCRFVTPAANNENTTRNVRVSAFGETKTISQWSRDDRCAVCYDTLHYRVSKGWNTEMAITETPRG